MLDVTKIYKYILYHSSLCNLDFPLKSGGQGKARTGAVFLL